MLVALQGYVPAAHMGAMGVQGGPPLQLQLAYNAAMQHPMFAHIQAGPHGPEIRIDGVRQDALGPLAMALAHLRQRRGGQQAVGGAHQHGVHAHARQRRPRGITLRISVRTILQVLVFAMVLYQVRACVGQQRSPSALWLAGWAEAAAQLESLDGKPYWHWATALFKRILFASIPLTASYVFLTVLRSTSCGTASSRCWWAGWCCT